MQDRTTKTRRIDYNLPSLSSHVNFELHMACSVRFSLCAQYND